MENTQFLLIGLQKYQGSPSRDVLRFFKASNIEEARKRVLQPGSVDDRNGNMESLEDKRLYQKVSLE